MRRQHSLPNYGGGDRRDCFFKGMVGVLDSQQVNCGTPDLGRHFVFVAHLSMVVHLFISEGIRLFHTVSFTVSLQIV